MREDIKKYYADCAKLHKLIIDKKVEHRIDVFSTIFLFPKKNNKPK